MSEAERHSQFFFYLFCSKDMISLQFFLSLSLPPLIWPVRALSDDYFVCYLYYRFPPGGPDS